MGHHGVESPDRRYDVLLFDLGGVLVQWDGNQGLLELAGVSLGAEGARRFWLESKWVRRFERGRCSPQDFAAGVVQELCLKMDADQFLARFTSWDRGPFPGAIELLQALRREWNLACLSNNNVIHWTRLKDLFGFDSLFDRTFLSFEIDLIKPDPEVYQYVQHALGIPASRILFFDDNPECTQAAQREGFAAATVRGVEALRRELVSLLG